MGFVITLQELSLHLAHVHVRCALRFATLAAHAEIQHAVKFLALHRLLTIFSHELAQHVSSAPRAVFLLVRGHIAWTHRSSAQVCFAAVSGSIALLGGREHAAGGRPIKKSRPTRADVTRFVAQVFIHAGGIDDLSRIENS